METPKDTVVVIRDSRATVTLLFTAHVLLLVIAILLYSIYLRLPPTVGDLQELAANAKDRKAVQKLMARQPLIRIPWEVDVQVTNPSLGVEVTNSSLDVEVTNSSLGVEVENIQPIRVVLMDRW